ncbi:uncharacterized protein LOC116184878 [Apis dorsata]|uniref:uncharacterized protein LOC116184878 n=1 Tax=Apis dorsata TaxID=7462 RepID=UPI001293F6FC|nr:uncharacterized protein LOC116184878 [Apis dorsata]
MGWVQNGDGGRRKEAHKGTTTPRLYHDYISSARTYATTNACVFNYALPPMSQETLLQHNETSLSWIATSSNYPFNWLICSTDRGYVCTGNEFCTWRVLKKIEIYYGRRNRGNM